MSKLSPIMISQYDFISRVQREQNYYRAEDVDARISDLERQLAEARLYVAQAEEQHSALLELKNTDEWSTGITVGTYCVENYILKKENKEIKQELEELREAVIWWLEVSAGNEEYGWSFWFSDDANDELSESYNDAWEEVEKLLKISDNSDDN